MVYILWCGQNDQKNFSGEFQEQTNIQDIVHFIATHMINTKTVAIETWMSKETS